MKFFFAIWLFLLFCSNTFPDGKSGKKTSDNISDYSNVALIIAGHVVNTGFDFEKAKYRLYRDNQFVAGGYTDKFGSMELRLMRNSRYLLEISAIGFIAKKIYFNTDVDENNRTVHFFDFDVELLFNGLEEDETFICELDIPFAIVFFNRSTQEFDYDMTYTEKIMDLEKKILN